MFKKHMSPLQPHTKKGTLVAHSGKGASETTLPNRGALNQLAGGPQTPNNYAKATPMSAGAPPDPSASMGSSPVGNDDGSGGF